MKTMINIKAETSLKREAQKLAEDLGLSLSTVVNYFLKQFVSERKITFTDHPMPNKATRMLLEKIDRDIKAGRNMAGPFNSADEMIASLKL
jgi:addiction module RelB/DinJ family antitoxin